MIDLPNSMLFLHALSMIFWIGGLFAYLFIVWPSIFKVAQGRPFPREMLGMLAHRTGPWIYLAMVSALITAVVFVFSEAASTLDRWVIIGYLVVLCLLIANNTYGTLGGWARILWAPQDKVMKFWRNFYARMFISFVLGISLLAGQLMYMLMG